MATGTTGQALSFVLILMNLSGRMEASGTVLYSTGQSSCKQRPLQFTGGPGNRQSSTPNCWPGLAEGQVGPPEEGCQQDTQARRLSRLHAFLRQPEQPESALGQSAGLKLKKASG